MKGKKPNIFLRTLLGMGIIAGSADAKRLDVSSATTSPDVGTSTMSIYHDPDGKEGADSKDFKWDDAPPNPNAQWLKQHSEPYSIELKRDYRPTDSYKTVHVKSSVVGGNATGDNYIKFEIKDDSNFTGKNIFAERYGTDDVNDPKNMKEVFDVRNISGQYIRLADLVDQPEGVYDNWLVKFCNPADLNRNGKVDLVDFAILSGAWGRENTMPRSDASDLGAYADINKNGKVDLVDLMLMTGNWLWDNSD